MRMHFPDMMASMDVKKEVKRLDAVDLDRFSSAGSCAATRLFG